MSATGVFVGLTTLDIIQRVDALPGPDEKVTSTRLDVAAGGPAANAAVAYAALGGHAVLVSVLGEGPLADIARADLSACGVEVRDLGGRLPVSSIMITEATGERAVVGRDGLGEPEAPSWLGDLTGAAAVVEVDGHYPRLALACQGDVVVDAGRWKPVFGQLARPGVTFACSSGWAPPEVAALGHDIRERQEQGAAWLAERGVSQVCFTNGADPVRWWEFDDGGGVEGEIAVPPRTVRDTVGAGDVFHGALCHARATGASWPDQIRAGSELAGRRVETMGPRAYLSGL